MAAETVQIKHEPLDMIETVKMANTDGVATIAAAKESSWDWNYTNEFSECVAIKVEPDMSGFDETNRWSCSNDAQNMLTYAADVAVEVPIKVEPEDALPDTTYDCNTTETMFNETKIPCDDDNLPQPTHDIQAARAVPSTVDDFQVVDEHENIITVSAAASPQHRDELQLIQRMQAFYDCVPKRGRPQRAQNHIKCQLCLKRFLQDSAFFYHMDQHNDNRLFCYRKTCESWFETFEECERHEYEVHDVNPCKCNVCNHKFNSFEQLCVHKNLMHKNLQRYTCSICRDWFISFEELYEHWTALPDRCGRILKLRSISSNSCSYNIKSASRLTPAGAKLRLKATAPTNASHLNTKKLSNDVKIMQKAVGVVGVSDAILPDKQIDLPIEIKTEPRDSYELEKTKLISARSDIDAPPLKLRLRKQPERLMTPPDMETPMIHINPNPLGHALAQRITSKFSLKTVPKMFRLTTTQSNVADVKSATVLPIPPESAAPKQPETGTTTQPNRNALPLGNTEHPSKLLKLSSNVKIVKFLPTPDSRFVQVIRNSRSDAASTKEMSGNEHPTVVNSHNSKENASSVVSSGKNMPKLKIQFTTPQGEKLFSNRQFMLKKIEVAPTVNQTLAAVKLNAIAATNKELSLTELLNETMLSEKPATAKPTEIKREQLKATLHIPIEQIKTEVDNDMEMQIEDSWSATNFSDSSLGSCTKAALTTALEDDYGELPKKPPSSHLSINKEKELSISGIEGCLCPKCGRRYSTRSVVREHLQNNCGRNPQHECNVCHKRFFSANTLNCHRTIHTGELPHKCNYCDKRFRTRGQVTVHHRTHTGERPFVCEICSQNFTHRETLISHLSRHIGMKRYKCYGCNKQFSCISGLSMHRSTRPNTCGKLELNTRAVGPRVRVIRGRVVFEPQPLELDPDTANDVPAAPAEVLTEIQNI